ncbi:MAG: hypothetical protein LBL72_06620 [Candidatus Accumulibacter sp.]|jgi:hypothetical protein|nr:hypothetical protein [Accumulibacter sp.]
MAGQKWDRLETLCRIRRRNSMSSYAGEIYIDVPFDENDPTYKMVDGFLAHDDMTPKIEGSIFFHLPLEVAMQNRHHDEPGFWDKWAENW